MTRIVLEDYRSEIDALENAVQQKISNSLISSVNADIKKELEIKADMLAVLLVTIESKVKRCQELYAVYFENVDHDALNGISSSPGKRLDFEVVDTFGQKNISVSVSDTDLYRDLIQCNFEFYILTVASVYENLVFLTEMLLRKTIVHLKENGPLSMPLQMLIDYRRLLIKLQYQSADDFITCINRYDDYFNDFLPAIRDLRNSFIHGFKNNIGPDGTKYIITRPSIRGKFGNSPRLELNNFTGEITLNTISFTKELITCLAGMIGKAASHIPV